MINHPTFRADMLDNFRADILQELRCICQTERFVDLMANIDIFNKQQKQTQTQTQNKNRLQLVLQFRQLHEQQLSCVFHLKLHGAQL